MKWFRRHIKTGSRLALFALAVQFMLSFGHFHPIAAAQAAPGLSLVDLAYIGTSATPDLAVQVTGTPQPANPDNDRHPADNCAICAVISLASSMLFTAPPVLLLPEAIELLFRTTNAEFAHLKSAPAAFHSRAPPPVLTSTDCCTP
ncbi:DUF2946 family protein [Bradyrhizobium elkanii]|uniref:DUF2946 family protein n=1 Tax=Bradyrhizobium elkanii TaxID=29448 RepID=UPI00209DA40D|nr:DUF2946 family protein [Bradyrhizobium elkanii]MCP1967230.1 hypothetical protein [Bradyrhizobium elkanii]MCS3523399.1 hypothetical protein [Bradyrhizobium elkanii]MCS4071054.1 hypothetical protein [Bradyrhizobium elkanii]MCS4077685.1 hypothetical protein [Bradyrhizobium elkanii]MCS4111265.1 hypothetical protein [Bradyrhizobium elkanii]